MHFQQEIFQFYEGNIFHKRYVQKDHSFKNKSSFLLINLNKLSNKKNLNISKNLSFFSINKFNLLSWHIEDHGERCKNSTINDLINFIHKITNSKSSDKVLLFCFPRILGFGFNPLSIYYCFEKGFLTKTVFEVKNTFGDIHHYVLTNINKNGSKQKADKKLFVSPFFKNEGYYHLESKIVKNKIYIDIKYFNNKKIYLHANLKANAIFFSNLEILKTLIKLKLFPGKVWINIHYEAFKLWIKKVKICALPKEQSLKSSKSTKIK